MKRLSFILWIILLSGIGVICNAGSDLVIVDKGRTEATIVLADNAPERTSVAAKYLRDNVMESTGVSLSIVKESDAVSGSRILIGDSGIVRSLGVKIPSGSGFHDEGIIIKRIGSDLIIAGNDDGPYKNTQDAVFRFLNIVVGAEFYYGAPLGKSVPKLTRISVGNLDISEHPVFAQRTFYNYLSSGTTDWSAMDEFHSWHHWGGTAIEHRHIHADIAPPDVYFKTHPEYYSEIRGKRSVTELEGWQLCTTNPDVIKLAVERCRRRFAADPNLQAASLSCNDCYGMCTCAECRKLDYPDPVSGGGRRMVTFANAVARELAKTNPGKYVAFYAYYHTLAPPVDMKCEPNVIVVLADSGNCMFHDYNDPNCGLARDARLRLDGWMKVASQVLVYDYYGLYGGYMGLPFLNIERTVANSHYLANKGAHGLTCDGVYTPGPEGLRVYASLRTMWDRNLTPKQIIKQFCDGLYGKASPVMQDYYWHLEKICNGAKLHSTLVTWVVPGPLEIWTQEAFDTLGKDLSKARSLVIPGSVEMKRIDEQVELLDFAKTFIQLVNAELAYYRDETQFSQDKYALIRQAYLNKYQKLTEKRLISFSSAVLDDYAPKELKPIRLSLKLKATSAPPSPNPLVPFDPAWDLYGQTADCGGSFVDQNRFMSYPRTQATITYDSHALYLRVKCEDPEIEHVKPPVHHRDDDLWKDDCIRLSVVAPDRSGLLNFYVNAAGVCKDARDSDVSWNSDWNAKTSISNRLGARQWTARIEIPWSTLGLQAPPRELKANLFRHTTTTDVMPVQYWSPTFGSMDRIERYATISFE